MIGDSAFCRARPTAAILAQVLRVTGCRMVCGSREAAARRRWAAIARIGYAIRKARRDRFPQLPVCTDGRTLSAGAADSTRLESSQPAEDLRGDAPEVSPRSVPPAHAEASLLLHSGSSASMSQAHSPCWTPIQSRGAPRLRPASRRADQRSGATDSYHWVLSLGGSACACCCAC